MKIVRFVYQVNIQKFFPGSGSLLRKSWFTANSTITIVFLDGEFFFKPQDRIELNSTKL